VPIPMRVRRVIINEQSDQQHVVLQEIEGERHFPIVIGLFEAASLDRRLRAIPTPRPLTHQLIEDVVTQLGADIQDVVITELREHTYYAAIRIRQDGELVQVDCRPSDALAVAVGSKLPIYVHEDVLGELQSD